MSDKIIQLNEDLIKHDLFELSATKNEILNSASPRSSSFYSCTVDIYSFIHPWYGYLSF